ncbi:hypothetical protein A1Q2_01628 [Trichosporon asahii var. asahii CBS 8904]|uniref:Uncharacterized protein n=2 Tax=Trichosporon asahii var. asahii TaxID=189963 RepID=K1W5G7_TRIAC|nr:hypothetical protein A1Q1_05078 [Trichosporon asahii var. asahii CBS 2479]EJT46249.1 hypothetical protein A1Q1_05078 [Trichosporon asahii var. asahii CBS 2479]EKD04153.1 hypothetical protein A1Q2_01628 [Trichosporon asahii var. asahii CBS 8904]
MSPSEKRRMELLPVAHLLPPAVFDACGFDDSMFYEDEELNRAYRREFGTGSPSDSESCDWASDENGASVSAGIDQDSVPQVKRAPSETGEVPDETQGSVVRRRKRMVMDPELSRIRRASLRPRVQRKT